jgi:cytoskeleton protein RodZ
MTLDLGTTSLSQARIARGLTIEDAERSTRISRRFLVALEEHDYTVFPAPVYARGFLRTYCRYLGIDPEPQLEELPAGWTGTGPTTQLEPISKRSSISLPASFNVAWLVAGAVIVAVIGIGLYLNRGSSGLDDLQAKAQEQQSPTNNTNGLLGQPTASSIGASGSTASASATTGSEERVLEPGLPGVLPDFESVDVDAVTQFLDQQDITYLRIDTASPVTRGLVISQSPAAGSSTSGVEQVTLTVSSGASASGTARTDCNVLESTNQRTAAEQTYFEANCDAGASGTSGTLPDRTDCESIRGTDYRSTTERTFFLTNCVTQ